MIDLKRQLRLTKQNTVNKNGTHICHNTNKFMAKIKTKMLN